MRQRLRNHNLSHLQLRNRMPATTLFLAQLFGPVSLVMALSMCGNTKWYRKALEHVASNHYLIVLNGFMAFTLGFIVVLTHNHWSSVPEVVISVCGWIAVCKGALYLVFPKTCVYISNTFKNHALLLGSIALIFGSYMSWIGYIQFV